MLILLRDINYGGRISRLCYLIPVLVQTILIYMIYVIYYNISLISYKLIIISIIIINIEWPIVIVYEYIYISNISIYNNLLYNVVLLILVEILLFIGLYWLYINNIIHSSYNSSINEIISYTIIDSINANSNELCIISIISNLLILLYVTLILQMVHKYIGISNDMNSNSNNSIVLVYSNSIIIIITLIVYIYSNVCISIRSIVLSNNLSNSIIIIIIINIYSILSNNNIYSILSNIYSNIMIGCYIVLTSSIMLIISILRRLRSKRYISSNNIHIVTFIYGIIVVMEVIFKLIIYNLITLINNQYISNQYISSNNNNNYINIYTIAMLIKNIIRDKLYMHHLMKYMYKIMNKTVLVEVKDLSFMNKLFKILSIYTNVWYISSSNIGINIISLQYIDDKNIRIIIDEKERTSITNYNNIDIISDMDNIISITYNLFIDNKCVLSIYLYKASI